MDSPDTPNGDIVANLIISHDQQAIHDALANFRTHTELWPEGCVSKKWEYGSVESGVGASALLTYTPWFGWRRSLTAVVIADEPGRIEIDHPGDKGFVTSFTLEQQPAGVAVEMHTWVNPPPKPFQRLYVKRIQPKWQACHQGFLENIASRLAW